MLPESSLPMPMEVTHSVLGERKDYVCMTNCCGGFASSSDHCWPKLQIILFFCGWGIQKATLYGLQLSPTSVSVYGGIQIAK